jgi:hypothetical protein
MKNICMLLILTGFLSLSVQAQEKFPEIKTGTVLTYQGIGDGYVYDFIVTITDLSKGVAFDWTLSDPFNKKGSIIISETALASTTKYYNHFLKEDKMQSDESALFMSDVNFKEILRKKQATLDIQDENKGIWEGGDPDNFSIMYHEEEIYPLVYYLSLQDVKEGYRGMVVAKEGKYHLIVSISAGWNIRLQSIQ